MDNNVRQIFDSTPDNYTTFVYEDGTYVVVDFSKLNAYSSSNSVWRSHFSSIQSNLIISGTAQNVENAVAIKMGFPTGSRFFGGIDIGKTGNSGQDDTFGSFQRLTKLKTLVLANNCGKIIPLATNPPASWTSAEGPFAGCTALEEIISKDEELGRYKIGTYYSEPSQYNTTASTFKDCTSLREITFPYGKGIDSPKEYKNCSSLETINIYVDSNPRTETISIRINDGADQRQVTVNYILVSEKYLTKFIYVNQISTSLPFEFDSNNIEEEYDEETYETTYKQSVKDADVKEIQFGEAIESITANYGLAYTDEYRYDEYDIYPIQDPCLAYPSLSAITIPSSVVEIAVPRYTDWENPDPETEKYESTQYGGFRGNVKDLTFSDRTMAEVSAMESFPFNFYEKDDNGIFHASDGDFTYTRIAPFYDEDLPSVGVIVEKVDTPPPPEPPKDYPVSALYLFDLSTTFYDSDTIDQIIGDTLTTVDEKISQIDFSNFATKNILSGTTKIKMDGSATCYDVLEKLNLILETFGAGEAN